MHTILHYSRTFLRALQEVRNSDMVRVAMAYRLILTWWVAWNRLGYGSVLSKIPAPCFAVGRYTTTALTFCGYNPPAVTRRLAVPVQSTSSS